MPLTLRIIEGRRATSHLLAVHPEVVHVAHAWVSGVRVPASVPEIAGDEDHLESMLNELGQNFGCIEDDASGQIFWGLGGTKLKTEDGYVLYLHLPRCPEDSSEDPTGVVWADNPEPAAADLVFDANEQGEPVFEGGEAPAWEYVDDERIPWPEEARRR